MNDSPENDEPEEEEPPKGRLPSHVLDAYQEGADRSRQKPDTDTDESDT